jgi:hypothetical protein
MDDNKNKEYMSAEEIIKYLSMLEWSSWDNYSYGKKISTVRFADILDNYNIYWSRKGGAGKDRNNHVWRKVDFHDQWSRIPASTITLYESSTSTTTSTSSTAEPLLQEVVLDKEELVKIRVNGKEQSLEQLFFDNDEGKDLPKDGVYLLSGKEITYEEAVGKVKCNHYAREVDSTPEGKPIYIITKDILP